MTEIKLYYKLLNLDSILLMSKIEAYKELYYDEECTDLAGYYFVSTIGNIVDTRNRKAVITMTLYFKENIISYNYVKNKNDTIITPVSFDNSWNGKEPLGVVTRTILGDNVTRQIIIQK